MLSATPLLYNHCTTPNLLFVFIALEFEICLDASDLATQSAVITSSLLHTHMHSFTSTNTQQVVQSITQFLFLCAILQNMALCKDHSHTFYSNTLTFWSFYSTDRHGIDALYLCLASEWIVLLQDEQVYFLMNLVVPLVFHVHQYFLLVRAQLGLVLAVP
jgi:hypothetical protein